MMSNKRIRKLHHCAKHDKPFYLYFDWDEDTALYRIASMRENQLIPTNEPLAENAARNQNWHTQIDASIISFRDFICPLCITGTVHNIATARCNRCNRIVCMGNTDVNSRVWRCSDSCGKTYSLKGNYSHIKSYDADHIPQRVPSVHTDKRQVALSGPQQTLLPDADLLVSGTGKGLVPVKP